DDTYADSCIVIPEDAAPQAKCGENVCSDSESCLMCPNNCGECPACNAAPSCSDGTALPSKTLKLPFDVLSAPVSDADGGVPDGRFPASDECGGAQLRIRISRIEVGHQAKMVWLPTGTISGSAQSYYC